jgi:hypothetical protein
MYQLLYFQYDTARSPEGVQELNHVGFVIRVVNSKA